MSSQSSDKKLVKRVQKGDKGAFDLLVLKYQHKIVNLVMRYVRDPELALDITQEAFIKAYRALTNFRGETKPLNDIFQDKNGIPTGTGDCCAPKLLNFAVKNNLTPLGLAEFYWGKENKSATRQHGRFYQSCTSKCQPILGFMLCGLDEL